MSGLHPSDNPVMRQLQLLLVGYGYNFYDKRNMARADDLLVRQKACGALGSAPQTLAALQSNYQRRYVPPSTRENPYPPAETMARLRGIGELSERVCRLEERIRGMPVPTQDRVWWRFREELPLLNRLLEFDLALVQQTQELEQQVSGLTANRWDDEDIAATLESLLQRLERTIRERQQFLQTAM